MWLATIITLGHLVRQVLVRTRGLVLAGAVGDEEATTTEYFKSQQGVTEEDKAKLLPDDDVRPIPYLVVHSDPY
jgi:hypothetical protein